MPRLTINTFTPWLQQRIEQDPHPSFKAFSGRQEDMPDRCVTVYKSAPGYDLHDGAFEQVSFRCVTRGRSESLSDAENLALVVDNILDAQRNVMIGQIYVTEIWTQMRPTQMPMMDKNSRYQFAAIYVAVASKYN